MIKYYYLNTTGCTDGYYFSDITYYGKSFFSNGSISVALYGKDIFAYIKDNTVYLWTPDTKVDDLEFNATENELHIKRGDDEVATIYYKTHVDKWKIKKDGSVVKIEPHLKIENVKIEIE